MDGLWNRFSAAVTPVASKIAEPVIGTKPPATPAPLQRVGTVRDHTQVFVSKRTESRIALERSIREHLEAVGKSLRSAPRSSSSSLSLLRNKGGGGGGSTPAAAPLDSFCRTCGDEFGVLLAAKRAAPCALCSLSFCTACVVKLPVAASAAPAPGGAPDKSAAAVPSAESRGGEASPLAGLALDSRGRLTVCHGCEIKASQLEKQHRFHEARVASLRSPLFVAFMSLQAVKEQLSELFARYDYLAGSICSQSADVKTGNIAPVWENSMALAAQLQRLFADFDKRLRQLASVPVESASRSERLKQVMTTAMTTFQQERLPRFRILRKELLNVELKATNNLYIVVHRLCRECARNEAFWGRFGEPLRRLLATTGDDLRDRVTDYGEPWEEHQKALQEMISSWEVHSPSLLRLNNKIETEPEASLCRKGLSVLRQCEVQLHARLGQRRQTASAQLLHSLIEHLEHVYAQQSMALAREAAWLSPPPDADRATTGRKHEHHSKENDDDDEDDFGFVLLPKR